MSSINDSTKLTVSRKVSPLWRNRDYMLLWSGQLVSSIGSGVSGVAFPLLILAVTGSPAQAGIAAALSELPYLLLSLPAGALVDRWNRKYVMILCDAGRALCLASILLALLLGLLGIVQIYLVTLLEGSFFVFFNIAQAASLPSVVEEQQLPAAVAQNIATYGISGLLGPSIGGALYSIMQGLPFLADAVSYLVSVFSLFLIRVPFQPGRDSALRPRQLYHEIGEGLSWLWRHPLIRFLALKSFLGNLTQSGTTLLVIIIAQRQHASSFVIGLILAFGGIGSLLGALSASSMQKRLSFGQVIIGCSWIVTVVWPLFLIAPNAFVLGGLMVIYSFALPIHNVVLMSYRLALVPDSLRGRVTSVFRLISYGGFPLGLALTGVLIQRVGVTLTIFILLAGLLTSTVATTLYPAVRHAPALTQTT